LLNHEPLFAVRKSYQTNANSPSARTSFPWVTAAATTPQVESVVIFGNRCQALSTIFRFHQILRSPEESKVVPKPSWNTHTTRKAEPTEENLTAQPIPISGIAGIAGGEEPRGEGRRERYWAEKRRATGMGAILSNATSQVPSYKCFATEGTETTERNRGGN
jgi:hypothetical protein